MLTKTRILNILLFCSEVLILLVFLGCEKPISTMSITELESIISEGDSNERKQAYDIISGETEYDLSGQIPQLFALLRHERKFVRVLASQGINTLEKEDIAEILPDLLQMLDSKRATDRNIAIVTLRRSKVDDIEFLTRLKKFVESDPDEEVRETAAFTLGYYTTNLNEVVEALSEALNDESCHVRKSACNSLSNVYSLGADVRAAVEILFAAEKRNGCLTKEFYEKILYFLEDGSIGEIDKAVSLSGEGNTEFENSVSETKNLDGGDDQFTDSSDGRSSSLLSELNPNFIEQGQFTIYCSTDEEERAQYIFSVLENTLNKVRDRLPLDNERVSVLIATNEQFRSYLGHSWVDGYSALSVPSENLIILKKIASYDSSEKIELAIYHELMHILLSKNVKQSSMPLWLVEGLCSSPDKEYPQWLKTELYWMAFNNQMISYDLLNQNWPPGPHQVQSVSMTNHLRKMLGDNKFWDVVLAFNKDTDLEAVLQAQTDISLSDFLLSYNGHIKRIRNTLWLAILAGSSLLLALIVLFTWKRYRLSVKGTTV